MERTNALAELAERLRNGIYIDKSDKRFGGPVICASLDANDVLNAQRIVAELAKVKIVRNQYSNEICWPTTGDVMDAFDRIIAIAEEGAGDGK